MKKTLFSLAIFAFFLSLFAEKANAQASGLKPELYMYRHNGSLGGSPAPAATGNTLGTLQWRGLTAIGSVLDGATIRSVATNVAPGIMSANMYFSTRSFGGLTDKVVITPEGLVGIGEMNPVFHLDVVGNTHTSGRFWGRIHYDNNNTGNEMPNTFIDEAYFERKVRTDLGLAANAYTNGGILSLAPGGNSLDRQLFTGGNDGLWTRSQDLAGANSWAAWEKILTSGDINGRENMLARYMPPGPITSTLRDGQVFDNGTNVVIGGIPAFPAAPAPSFVPTDELTVQGDARVEDNLVVEDNATVTGSTTTGSLSVTNDATVSGNVGIGKAPTAFDLDVMGESNFDGRVKVGAANFPTFAGAAFYELAVGGGIIAEEVLVRLQSGGGWADYVFADDYAVKPLPEVEAFVKKEKHLPGVPSAAEVAEKGLSLGEMQKIQMEKIEELYLHVIEMNKQVQTLKSENESLKSRVTELEKR
ncbi:MAG: hypothetical protein IPH31_12675 [Lewinellaceae bacterium]|nr:hypothetical protein [Lewinellaceae bacterium]